jgi:biopolymer transport protein ExbB
VVYAGLVEADQGTAAAEEAMAAASARQRLKLEKRLAFLGTIGSNAPFVGLLGTVIGVVAAFHSLTPEARAAAAADTVKKAAEVVGAAAAPAATDRLMNDISEALVATAVGLIVALPAVAAYNGFQRIVRSTLANTEALGHVLLAHLKAAAPAAAVAATTSASVPPAASNDAPRSETKKGDSSNEQGAY